MTKYPISKEFGIFRNFTPPINKRFLALAAKYMKPPRFLFKDKSLVVEKHTIKSFDGEGIEVLTITPVGIDAKMPCLIYNHGGGFVLEAAGYHYDLCMQYAKALGCKVVFVKYRLVPKYAHTVLLKDCYSAFTWAYDNAEALNIDIEHIGIGGDSAGATLAVAVCMMAKEMNHPINFRFQMLPYPYLDARNQSESVKKYTDTPMWNSTLSAKIGDMIGGSPGTEGYIYFSPVEAQSFDGMPPAYIETAEFDCLHDDGILYANLLKESGVTVELNETKGTMHGYDIVLNASITRDSVAKRIAFMKKYM